MIVKTKTTWNTDIYLISSHSFIGNFYKISLDYLDTPLKVTSRSFFSFLYLLPYDACMHAC